MASCFTNNFLCELKDHFLYSFYFLLCKMKMQIIGNPTSVKLLRVSWFNQALCRKGRPVCASCHPSFLVSIYPRDTCLRKTTTGEALFTVFWGVLSFFLIYWGGSVVSANKCTTQPVLDPRTLAPGSGSSPPPCAVFQGVHSKLWFIQCFLY